MENIKRSIIESNNEICRISKELNKTVENIYGVILLKYQLKLNELNDKEQDRLMHKQEVIIYLKISLRTYYRYKQQKILVPIKIGEADYYYESDLQHLLADLKKQGRY